MTTRYTSSDGQEFDKDGLPISRPTPQPQPAVQSYSHNDPFERNYSPIPTAFPAPGVTSQPDYPTAPKSKIIAAILFFFLGGVGVGNFYLNQNGRGFLKIGLTVLGLITSIFIVGFVFLAAVGLWSLIETVLVLTGAGGYDRDARGIPLD